MVDFYCWEVYFVSIDQILDTTFVKVSEIRPKSISELFMDYLGDVIETYKYINDLESTYPNFYKWYNDKVLLELKQKPDRREILLAVSTVKSENVEKIKRVISGIAVLKKYEDEKKICTFRILKDFRDTGIAYKLMDESIKFLETDCPLITISDNNLKSFEKLLKFYNFQQYEKLKDYYKKGVTEYVFNGVLK